MIRRIYANVGSFALFVIGTDKALERLVEAANNLDGPCPCRPGIDPYSPEGRAERAARKSKPYRRPLWLKVQKALDARLRNR